MWHSRPPRDHPPPFMANAINFFGGGEALPLLALLALLSLLEPRNPFNISLTGSRFPKCHSFNSLCLLLVSRALAF